MFVTEWLCKAQSPTTLCLSTAPEVEIKFIGGAYRSAPDNNSSQVFSARERCKKLNCTHACMCTYVTYAHKYVSMPLSTYTKARGRCRCERTFFIALGLIDLRQDLYSWVFYLCQLTALGSAVSAPMCWHLRICWGFELRLSHLRSKLSCPQSHLSRCCTSFLMHFPFVVSSINDTYSEIWIL